jgi:hypothetical protein
MFWQFFSNGGNMIAGSMYHSSSELDRMLEREAHLNEILEFEDLLQELRCNHSGLIEL